MKKTIFIAALSAGIFLSFQPPKKAAAENTEPRHCEARSNLISTLQQLYVVRKIKKQKLQDLQQSFALVNQNLK